MRIHMSGISITARSFHKLVTNNVRIFQIWLSNRTLIGRKI